MKKIVVHSNYDILNKNGNMLKGIGDVSVKDFLKQMVELKKQGLKNNQLFSTSDQTSIKDADAFLFIDLPEPNDTYLQEVILSGKPMYLWTWESGIINSINFDPKSHTPFCVIFTYDDTLVDNKKYVKTAYSFDFPEKIQKRYEDKKLCCLIAGNKASNNPLELYSQRIEAIKWFEVNHPSDFDLYGQGWRKVIPPENTLHRIINKFTIINKCLKPQYVSYCGEVDNQKSTYEKYRFAICYENANGLHGYISEKIFNCFFAGCVPIYLGAPNILEYIPKNCFIDKRQFKNFENLYDYLTQMTSIEYFNYLNSIEKFLQDSKDDIFTIDYFTKTITSHIACNAM